MVETEAVCQKCEELNAVLDMKTKEIEALKLEIKELTEKLTLSADEIDIIFQNELLEPKNKSKYNRSRFKNSSTQTKSKEFEQKVPTLTQGHEGMQHMGDFVYNEELKQYYSPSTGYYYDQEKQLLLDPHTGLYYKYDYTLGTYEPYEPEKPATTPDASCETVTNQVHNLNLNDDVENFCSTITDEENEVKFSETENFNSEEKLKNAFENVDNVKKDEPTSISSDWQVPEGSSITVSDLVKEVVNERCGMADYVYDENYQMYYSAATGYYFDADKNLLYEPYSKTYYKYDSEKQTYDLYCPEKQNEKIKKLTSKTEHKKHKKKDKHKEKKKDRTSKHKKSSKTKKRPKVENGNLSSPEEGEIMSEHSEDSLPGGNKLDSEIDVVESNSSGTWPPCIRAIVEESSKLKIGSLLLITCIGGILGREKSNAVYIPDISVSKAHAQVSYDESSWQYTVEDLGSQNGTFINDHRLSKPKEKSAKHVLSHRDKMTLGSCKLLLHIHSGTDTCDQCEPGQILADQQSQKSKVSFTFKSKVEKEKERKQELQNIKKKYGLKNMAYDSEKKNVPAPEYSDRAEERRKTVGSENPYEKDGESATVEKPLSSKNKGFQMLKKMGWKEGEGLGSAHWKGVVEPVNVSLYSWNARAGLGSTEMYQEMQPIPEDKKNRKWVKAQKRYLELDDCNK